MAITGGKTVGDADTVWATLDRTREKYGDMVLLHGGGPGVEKIAASWAEARGVNQVICRPDWSAHGKAAPFRRNDELLNLLPKGVIAFPGSGITGKPRRQGEAAGNPGLSRRRVTAAIAPSSRPVLRFSEGSAFFFASCAGSRIDAERPARR